MKIRSKEAKCHCSCSSFRRISKSWRSSSTVLSVDLRNISETPIKIGLLSSMIQPRGEIDISQLVNAYSASMVLSGEIPEGKCTNISTSAAVLSSIFLIFILPLSLAFSIESINEEVVVAKGISVMTKVVLSR